MITALIIAGSVLGYGAIGGAINGWLRLGTPESQWENPLPVLGSIFWPITAVLWAPWKLSEYISNKTLTFLEEHAEKKANKALSNTQHRIREIKKTRVDLKTAQEELREAEEELERELRENGR